MRAHELVREAKMDRGIRDALEKQGYQYLGQGQDQDAYLAPDGTILKVFGWDQDRSDHGLSRAQQSFVDFATYCQQHPNNPFLPDFGGWETFEFNGNTYLQIKCERLFDFEDHGDIENVSYELENLGEWIHHSGREKAIQQFLKRYETDDEYGHIGETVTMLGGERGLKLMAKTIEDLVNISKAKNYRFDLHGGNYMLGSDGTIVINDPYFTGSWRDEDDDFTDWNTADPSGGDNLSWGNTAGGQPATADDKSDDSLRWSNWKTDKPVVKTDAIKQISQSSKKA